MDVCGEGGEAVSEWVAAVERAMLDHRAAKWVEDHADMVPIRGLIVATEAVKLQAGDGSKLPGKCRITFKASNEDDDEQIETDWLSDPIALRNAKLAKASVGQTVTLFKLNAPDPDKKVAQGFRRVVWIEA